VRRLQDRIYRAAAAGNRRQVKNLQKLLVDRAPWRGVAASLPG
jgi:hypothetical protein